MPAHEVPPPPEPISRPPPKKHWWQGYMAPLSEEERRAAIEDPGPSWTEYFLWQYLKWCFGLFVLIADSLILLTFLQPLALAPLIISLGIAVYLEFLLWSYLWHRPPVPGGGTRRVVPANFRRTWYRPYAYGIWTPEAKMIKEGADLETPESLRRKEFF